MLGTVYRIECTQCEKRVEEEKESGGEGGGSKAEYIGETSRSTYERLKEHMWLFVNKKEGDPEKLEASSVLWKHSKEDHKGELRMEDWKSSVVSTHLTALNRQVTEAVHISNGGENKRRREVRLLNSKQEFGANVLLEVVVMRGDQILGQRNQKRRRSYCSRVKQNHHLLKE